MKDPKVGERVAVYGESGRELGTIITINLTHAPTTLWVRCDDSCEVWVCPEQCRRLKKPAERRHIWVYEYAGFHGAELGGVFQSAEQAAACSKGKYYTRTVEFVEVRKKRT